MIRVIGNHEDTGTPFHFLKLFGKTNDTERSELAGFYLLLAESYTAPSFCGSYRSSTPPSPK